MWDEKIKLSKKPLVLDIPENWNLHTNGRGNTVFLVNPDEEQILFRVDQIPYLCVTTIIVYLTYQFSSFMQIHDLTIKAVSYTHLTLPTTERV